jgi:hypothetical protein
MAGKIRTGVSGHCPWYLEYRRAAVNIFFVVFRTQGKLGAARGVIDVRLGSHHGEVIDVTKNTQGKIVREYPLPEDMHIREGYHVFPLELEEDPKVVFHATAMSNFNSIVAEGFKHGSKAGATLDSISYAKTSSISLDHWVRRRSKEQDGVILALRFESYEGLCQESQFVYDYKQVPTQPEIIGFVSVPASYTHQ